MIFKLLAIGIFPLIVLACNVLRWRELRKSYFIHKRTPLYKEDRPNRLLLDPEP
jgi:hypothetical protein